MQVVVAGGTGLLGAALVAALRRSGHTVTVLSRGSGTGGGQVQWNPADPSGAWVAAVAASNVVVNLAGESIAGPRWTAQRKRELVESRIAATEALVRAIRQAPNPPALVSGSAIGYYGAADETTMTEESRPGSDFLARLCVDWENAALQAAPATRVVCLRTGVVLTSRGGALPPMALPFRLFVGGPIGSGRQYVSWIHLDDWVALAQIAVTDSTLSGPLNLTAPNPVTNRELATALGRALHRPAFIPTPALPIRLALGEMADAAILSGQRVIPSRATSLGYRFQYATIDAALSSIYR